MQKTRTHISQVGRVILPVADQDRALEFYVDTLGFEKRADIPFGDGERWLEVAPTGSGTAIAIMPRQPGREPGDEQTCIVFTTTDLDADHAALREHGVDLDEPMGGEHPVPRMFFFRDLDGNTLLAVEEAEA
jgi:catechol 2,3-dioxygenase-like lactoylglutathione lyase family enzyme